MNDEGTEKANEYVKSIAYFYDVMDEIENKRDPDGEKVSDEYPSRIICEGMIKRANALAAQASFEYVKRPRLLTAIYAYQSEDYYHDVGPCAASISN